MKIKSIHIAISALILTLLVPTTSRAAVVEYDQACPGVGTSCAMNIGDVISISAGVYTATGDPIVGPSVSYVWQVNSGQLLLGGAPTTLANPPFTQVTNSGSSKAYISFAPGAVPVDGELQGVVQVTATNGPLVATQRYSINARCDSEPRLYSAIASVRLSSDQGWHSANADVLETCRIEYQLKNNTGWTGQ